MGIFDKKDDRAETVESEKLLLREEELDIAKDRIQTGEVTLRKEIVEEQKTMNVPVSHEEVVIERRALNNEISNSPIGDEETIRIPVSAEKVEVGKHTVITGEVSTYKKDVEETEEITETLKKEEARIETEGDPNIVDTHLQ